jgi:chloramphenicol 3-O-phosphotransferase
MGHPGIYLISGVPGSGKISVSMALMRRFSNGLHIPVDSIREWIVSGIAHPVPVWTTETSRQFLLARRTAAQAARIYADAGFAVAIDDVIFPGEAEELFIEPLSNFPIHKILLLPSLQVALARNASRTSKNFDTASLIQTITELYRNVNADSFEENGWAVLDNTDLSIEQIVEQILEL